MGCPSSPYSASSMNYHGTSYPVRPNYGVTNELWRTSGGFMLAQVNAPAEKFLLFDSNHPALGDVRAVLTSTSCHNWSCDLNVRDTHKWLVPHNEGANIGYCDGHAKWQAGNSIWAAYRNGAMNPYAQFQKEITLTDVLNSKTVADPLKVLDCSPITDGAAAVVLAPLDKAKDYMKNPVEIVASAQASGTLALHDRPTLSGIPAAQIAAQKAYAQAGMAPQDIDVAEVHDCFTIAELMAIEDLGFFPRGEGGKATLEGKTAIGNGRVVAVNTSGGLKAAGHPVGATGIKQAVEITWQLRGQAGKRQVPDAEIGLSHNVGGSGATAVVHIYRKVGA